MVFSGKSGICPDSYLTRRDFTQSPAALPLSPASMLLNVLNVLARVSHGCCYRIDLFKWRCAGEIAVW